MKKKKNIWNDNYLGVIDRLDPTGWWTNTILAPPPWSVDIIVHMIQGRYIEPALNISIFTGPFFTKIFCADSTWCNNYILVLIKNIKLNIYRDSYTHIQQKKYYCYY